MTMTPDGLHDDETVAGAAAAALRGYRYRHGDRPLEGYTVQRAAGRGAFGEVYYALSDSGREVALKVVNAYEQVELRGIRQCMNLKSPHLVSVFDVRFAADGRPVVVMEYVNGPSLRDLLDDAPSGFGAQKAAFFLREIGKGLTYLHDQGIVHRDVKPANIFYENGYVKIGDYGLSKAISTSHRGAQTVTVGTLHYMAPEVGAGQYDRGVDVYALGALLYEMLTGQPPFFGVSPAEVLMKHLSAQVDVTGIEEPFATVIRTALEKDPARRYQSVQQMVEAVYGAEHVRQSVSCFTPGDLTVVAARVTRNVDGLRPGVPPRPPSSRAFDVIVSALACPNRSALFGRLRDQARSLRHRTTSAVQRVRERARGAAGRYASPRPPAPPAPPRPVTERPALHDAVAVDPLATGHRRFLAVLAAAAVAIAAGAFSDGRDPGLSAWFALLGILGATLGVRWAVDHVLPHLARETRFVRQLAAGGLAGGTMLVVAFPAWVPALDMPGRRSFNVGPTLAAICLSLLAVNWAKRTARDRRDRVSLGSLLVVGAIAVAAALVLDAASEIVIAVLCGTCIAAQVASPWAGAGETAADAARAPAGLVHVPAAAAADAHTPPSADGRGAEARPAAPSEFAPLLTLPSVYSIARRSVAAGRSVVMWPIRLLIHAVAIALIVATFLTCVCVAFDLPGLLASGRIDPGIPGDIRDTMGIENWPFVLRTLGGTVAFVLACVALAFQAWVRRSRGGPHVLRGIAGTAALFVAPLILTGRGVQWGATGEPMNNGWEFWQAAVQGLEPKAVLCAAMLLIAALALLAWPRSTRAATADSSARADQPGIPAANATAGAHE